MTATTITARPAPMPVGEQLAALVARNLRTTARVPQLLMFSLTMPMAMLVLFSQVFRSVADGPDFPAGVSLHRLPHPGDARRHHRDGRHQRRRRRRHRPHQRPPRPLRRPADAARPARAGPHDQRDRVRRRPSRDPPRRRRAARLPVPRQRRRRRRRTGRARRPRRRDERPVRTHRRPAASPRRRPVRRDDGDDAVHVHLQRLRPAGHHARLDAQPSPRSTRSPTPPTPCAATCSAPPPSATRSSPSSPPTTLWIVVAAGPATTRRRTRRRTGELTRPPSVHDHRPTSAADSASGRAPPAPVSRQPSRRLSVPTSLRSRTDPGDDWPGPESVASRARVGQSGRIARRGERSVKPGLRRAGRVRREAREDLRPWHRSPGRFDDVGRAGDACTSRHEGDAMPSAPTCGCGPSCEAATATAAALTLPIVCQDWSAAAKPATVRIDPERHRTAAATLTEVLRPLDIEVTISTPSIKRLRRGTDRVQPDLDRRRSLEDWVGAHASESTCCSVCGNSDCRTLNLDGATYEAVPRR